MAIPVPEPVRVPQPHSCELRGHRAGPRLPARQQSAASSADAAWPGRARAGTAAPSCRTAPAAMRRGSPPAPPGCRDAAWHSSSCARRTGPAGPGAVLSSSRPARRHPGAVCAATRRPGPAARCGRGSTIARSVETPKRTGAPVVGWRHSRAAKSSSAARSAPCSGGAASSCPMTENRNRAQRSCTRNPGLSAMFALPKVAGADGNNGYRRSATGILCGSLRSLRKRASPPLRQPADRESAAGKSASPRDRRQSGRAARPARRSGRAAA